jgi:hypothetical protein
LQVVEGEFGANQTLEGVNEAGAEDIFFGAAIRFEGDGGVGGGRADLNNTLFLSDLRNGDRGLGANFANDIFDAVLVNDLVGGINSGVGFALAGLNNRLDLHSQNAAFCVPFLDGEKGAIAGRDAESRDCAAQRGEDGDF